MSVLTIGSRGDSVIQWQELLIKAGYELPRFGVDGDYGSETAGATKQFQQDMGITVDGIVGIQTLQAMKVRLGMADPNSIPESGGNMSLEELTNVYENETGIVKPVKRAGSAIIPALGIAGLLYYGSKKGWFK